MTLDYVREFGLTLEPFKGSDLANVQHLRGQNYLSGHGPEPVAREAVLTTRDAGKERFLPAFR